MKPKDLRLRGTQILGREERSKQKVIEEYLDLEKGCMVKVYSSPEPLPYHQIPVGFTREDW